VNHDHTQEHITPHDNAGPDDQAVVGAQDKRRHGTDAARGLPAVAFGLGAAALAGVVVAVAGPSAVQPGHATESSAYVITVDGHHEAINSQCWTCSGCGTS
jgi:hypothetical protein